MSDALLIIDAQNAILDGAAPPDRVAEVTNYFKSMVARLAALKSAAKQTGTRIILVQNDGPAGHRLETGTFGWDIVPELSPTDDDIVVHKESCDSFHDTTLLDHLMSLGVARLIVGGCMTQFCVDTTVRRAVSLGFDVVLAADGHCTGDAGGLTQSQIIAHHNATLDGFDAGQFSVTVVPCASITFAPK